MNDPDHANPAVTWDFRVCIRPNAQKSKRYISLSKRVLNER